MSKDAAVSEANARSTKPSPAPATPERTSSSTTGSTTSARSDLDQTAARKESLTPSERLRIANVEREKLLREQNASKTSARPKHPDEIRAEFERLQRARGETPEGQQTTTPEPGTDTTTTAPAAKDTNLSKAKEALRRSGLWTDDEVATMGREEVLRRGRKLQRQASRQAAVTQELTTLRSGTNPNANAPLQQTTPSSSAGTPQSQPAAALDVEGLAKPFAEQWGEELGSAVKQLITGLQSHFAPQMASTLSAPLSSLAAAAPTPQQGGRTEVNDAQLVQELRGEMSGRFPDLANDDDFVELGEVANALLKTPAFALPATASVDERREAYSRLIEHAARMLDFEDVGGGSPDATTRRAGRLTAPNAQRRTVPQDPKQRARVKFEWLQAHPGDIVGAQRAAGEL